MEDTRQVAFSR